MLVLAMVGVGVHERRRGRTLRFAPVLGRGALATISVIALYILLTMVAGPVAGFIIGLVGWTYELVVAPLTPAIVIIVCVKIARRWIARGVITARSHPVS